MFEPNFRTTKKSSVFNKAFQSLSFRSNKIYSDNLIKTHSNKERIKQKTYGGILRIKYNTEYKYALVQGRYTGKWSFPKGHSNEGEMPLECTLREISEETGIDYLPSPKEYVNIGYGNYYIFDLEEQVPLIPRDTREIMDTKWVTLEEMREMSVNADVSFYLRENKGN
jgi:8-oxo-dGTP pyrophosphatase MutT (NUDIX family)